MIGTNEIVIKDIISPYVLKKKIVAIPKRKKRVPPIFLCLIDINKKAKNIAEGIK